MTRALDEYSKWIDDALLATYDLTGIPSGWLPDDPRFAWYEWFHSGMTPAQVATYICDFLTDDAAAVYAQPVSSQHRGAQS